MQRLAAGLHAVGAQMRRVEAPARVERRLVSAFRAHAELGGYAAARRLVRRRSVGSGAGGHGGAGRVSGPRSTNPSRLIGLRAA